MRTLAAVVCITVAVLFAAASIGTPVVGQSPDQTFDAVSIKQSTIEDTGWRAGAQPGGRWILVNAAILMLVREAYPVASSEYLGGPEWVREDRYDVTAVGSGAATPADMQRRLRALLNDRFGFRGHYENVERPVYDLVLDRPDRPLPPGLRHVALDCEARRAARLRGEKLEDLPLRQNGQPPCGYGMRYADSAQIASGGIAMATLAGTIQRPAGRVVVDKTGLDGFYEFSLSFTEKPGPGSDATDIFTSLREQLGLRLVPSRGVVEVFVIDAIDRPTPD